MACTVLSVFQRPALLETNEIILFAVKLNKNEIFNALFSVSRPYLAWCVLKHLLCNRGRGVFWWHHIDRLLQRCKYMNDVLSFLKVYFVSQDFSASK